MGLSLRQGATTTIAAALIDSQRPEGALRLRARHWSRAQVSGGSGGDLRRRWRPLRLKMTIAPPRHPRVPSESRRAEPLNSQLFRRLAIWASMQYAMLGPRWGSNKGQAQAARFSSLLSFPPILPPSGLCVVQVLSFVLFTSIVDVLIMFVDLRATSAVSSSLASPGFANDAAHSPARCRGRLRLRYRSSRSLLDSDKTWTCKSGDSSSSSMCHRRRPADANDVALDMGRLQL